ncbi:MAG: hypothetical protein ACPL88_10410, partial [Bryobacteraceae bacterium]
MERTAQMGAKLEAVKALDRLVESGAKTPDEVAAEKERLLKQPARKKWRVSMRVLLGALLLIALAMAALRAAAEPNGLAWLFAVVPAAGVVGDIATVLGPLLAVSVAVERLLETAF